MIVNKNINFKKNNFFVLSMFIAQCTAFGAASSLAQADSGSTEPERKHAQLIILNDEKNIELRKDKKSLLRSFVEGLLSKEIPMLVSSSIVWNYLNKFHPDNRKEAYKFTYESSVDWDAWKFFYVKDTQFFLFMPLSYINRGTELGFDLSSESLDSFPSSFDELYKRVAHNSAYKKVPSALLFKPEQLAKVIKKRDNQLVHDNQSPIWDMIINGHGSVDHKKIAGISVEVMRGLLEYLNNNLTMGTLFIETCSVGGKNSTLLQFDQAMGKDILLNLHYTVIIGSISDALTYRTRYSHQKWKNFFKLAAAESALGQLISMLASQKADETDGPLHITNLPQIWIPGGYGFQTFNVDKRIKILSKALVRAREDEGKSIVIPKTAQVVLVYPKEIRVPIIIENPNVIFVSMRKNDDKSYHRFRQVIIERKDEIGTFVNNFKKGHRANNALIIIEELLCSQEPSFRRVILSPKFGQDIPRDIPSYIPSDKKRRDQSIRLAQNQKHHLTIHAAIAKKIGIPLSSQNEVGNTSSSLLRSGFSIDELIEYGFEVPRVELDNDGSFFLNFTNRDIDDLSGLERIKDIEKVNNLYLSNNKIKKITSAAVSTAGSLVLIDLSSNDIEYIEAGAFSHKNNLREINLEQNPIVDDAVAMRQLNDGVSPNVQILPQNYSDISGDEINFGSGEVDYLEGGIFVFD